MIRLKTVAVVLALCASAAVSAPVAAQEFPSKPVRMVIGFPPGGGADILGRIVAQRLSERLGQQVVVDNRGGASGQIAADLVSKSAPDGHTVMLSTVTTFSILPLLKKLPFDTLKDFTPITLLARAPNLLVVHPSVPAASVKELIAYARANPGKLQYASPGIGTPQHLAAELFKSQSQVQMTHIPYKGSGQSISDLVGGVVQLNFDQISVVTPFVREGKLRALGVTTAKRFSLLPDMPTMQESGLEGFDLSTWWGLHAPAGVDPKIIARLNRETVAVLREEDVRQRFAKVGAEPYPQTPEEFTAFLRGESERLARVAKIANLKAE